MGHNKSDYGDIISVVHNNVGTKIYGTEVFIFGVFMSLESGHKIKNSPGNSLIVVMTQGLYQIQCIFITCDKK